MKSIKKREIVLGAGVKPSSPEFRKKCEEFVCRELNFNSKTLNLKLKRMVNDVKKFYKDSGLYLSE